MPGASDNTLKQLTERSPADWVVQGGWPAAPVTLIDADIATISGATDKVIHVTGTPDWLLTVDFHAGHDSAAKPPDLLLYNSALFKRHRLLVRSLLVLLHKGADSPQLTGLYERGFPGEPFDAALRYRVLRVWEVPARQWLEGGLGLVPLAPLGALRREQLPGVIAQVQQRLDRDAQPEEARDLWAATLILMGLRYEQALIERLMQGVRAMKESITYQMILREGEARGKTSEARKFIVLFGRKKFGEPSREEQAALDGVTEVERLEELALMIETANSWQQLLGLSSPRRRLGRRKSSS